MKNKKYMNSTGSSILRRKTKRSRKSRMMNRELKKLESQNKVGKQKIHIKHRGRPKNYSINNISSNNFKENSSNNSKKEFKSPLPVAKKHSNLLNLKKYSFSNELYYSLTDLLSFLKKYFNIDYENFILKDEQKQEFRAKINEFLTTFTIVYDKMIILVHEIHIEHFFNLIIQFVNLNFEKLIDKFEEVFEKIKAENLKEQTEYLKPSAFISETQIKGDDPLKKKGGQYSKYKTVPKWHHYAWDMIK
jgi:hypothetical protein